MRRPLRPDPHPYPLGIDRIPAPPPAISAGGGPFHPSARRRTRLRPPPVAARGRGAQLAIAGFLLVAAGASGGAAGVGDAEAVSQDLRRLAPEIGPLAGEVQEDDDRDAAAGADLPHAVEARHTAVLGDHLHAAAETRLPARGEGPRVAAAGRDGGLEHRRD